MSDPASRLRDLPLEATRVASGRIGRLAVAYLVAVIVTAVVRTLGLVIEESWVGGFDRLIAANGWSSLVLVPAMTALVAFVAAAPFATAFLVIAEGQGLRTRRAYVLAGLIVAVSTQFLLSVPFGLPLPSIGLVGLDAVAGAVGGWVAWIVGVRSAPPPPRLAPWQDV
ncbi:MAG: hypothetical protein GX458_13180 [Phyllobacteriaceae bacterium]|nr:hypothetical protein [Phyllobacteriaceae bacterium]